MSDSTNPAAPRIDYEMCLREALSFLGHNAREGHSSTLALLELQRMRADPIALAELIERVERNARKSLAAIDDFMDLSAARTLALRLEDVDLSDLLVEVVADAWSLVSRQGIRVLVGDAPEAAPVRADRELLVRALGKLLRDVAAHTPKGVNVHCMLVASDESWVLEIDDVAPAGVASASAWEGSLPPDARNTPGLAYLLLVAQRHGGSVSIKADAVRGHVLRFAMPRVVTATAP